MKISLEIVPEQVRFEGAFKRGGRLSLYDDEEEEEEEEEEEGRRVS